MTTDPIIPQEITPATAAERWKIHGIILKQLTDAVHFSSNQQFMLSFRPIGFNQGYLVTAKTHGVWRDPAMKASELENILRPAFKAIHFTPNLIERRASGLYIPNKYLDDIAKQTAERNYYSREAKSELEPENFAKTESELFEIYPGTIAKLAVSIANEFYDLHKHPPQHAR